MCYIVSEVVHCPRAVTALLELSRNPSQHRYWIETLNRWWWWWWKNEIISLVYKHKRIYLLFYFSFNVYMRACMRIYACFYICTIRVFLCCKIFLLTFFLNFCFFDRFFGCFFGCFFEVVFFLFRDWRINRRLQKLLVFLLFKFVNIVYTDSM